MERCLIVVYLTLLLRVSSGNVTETKAAPNISVNETSIRNVTSGRKQGNATTTDAKPIDFGDPFFQSMEDLYGPSSFNQDISNSLRTMARKLHEAKAAFVRNRRSTDMKTVDEIRENCTRLGGPEAFQRYVSAYDSFHTCLGHLIDFGQLREDLVVGKSNAMVDLVMMNYCSRARRIKKCFSSYFETVGACMEGQEKADHERLSNMSQAAVDYICYREGRRVELFVMEDGVECVGSKLNDVIRCSAQTVAPSFISSDPLNPVSAIARLVGSEEGCAAHQTFHHCVCDALEDCTETVAAEMLDRFFTVMENMMVCKKGAPAATKAQLLAADAAVAPPPFLWNNTAFLVTIVVIAVPLALVYLFFVRRIVRKR